MELLEAIKTRRSIRKYKPTEIPQENLVKILDAARLAPSAGNRQPWRFIVVKNPEIKKQVAQAARNQTFLADASVIIAITGDPENSPGGYSSWMERDPMMAGEHIALAATSLGYGTCWIGAFTEAEVKKILAIPERVKVVALMPVGVPDESPPPRPRKELKDMVFEDIYGKPLNP